MLTIVLVGAFMFLLGYIVGYLVAENKCLKTFLPEAFMPHRPTRDIEEDQINGAH